MSQGKSDSLLPLLLSLLATLGLLGIGAVLVLRLINNGEIIGNSNLNLGNEGQSTFTQVKNVPSGLFFNCAMWIHPQEHQGRAVVSACY